MKNFNLKLVLPVIVTILVLGGIFYNGCGESKDLPFRYIETLDTTDMPANNCLYERYTDYTMKTVKDTICIQSCIGANICESDSLYYRTLIKERDTSGIIYRPIYIKLISANCAPNTGYVEYKYSFFE